jgi:SPOR domain
VRRPVLFLLLLGALGCGEAPAPSSALTGGGAYEALLVRVPRAGGVVRVYRPGDDSVVWRSRDPAPPTQTLLGFDEYLGTLMARDSSGFGYGVNLRVGGVERLGTEQIGADAVADGAALFTAEVDRVRRITPVSTWSWRSPAPPTAIVPLPDGGALVVSNTGDAASMIRRVRPPESAPVDSLALDAVTDLRRTTAADLVWGVSNGDVVAVRTRDLSLLFSEGVSGRIRAIETTPSGDRLYVAAGGASLQVVDRFAQTETAAIDLPAPAVALRMDAEGVYLLARPASGNAFLVVAIGTGRVVATIEGEWREDLPVTTPAGTVVTARGADVVEVEITSGRERLQIPGGAADLWRQVRWDGFRPRRANLDGRLSADQPADTAAADSAFAAMVRARYGLPAEDTALSTGVPAPAAPEAAPPGAPVAPSGQAAPPPKADEAALARWMVGFATLSDATAARALAGRVRGARVEQTTRDGAPAWRVVLGPFPSRDAAERAGMAADLPFWVFDTGR